MTISSYKFTTITDPSAYPGSTEPFGINDKGAIVGSYLDSSNPLIVHGFLDVGGTFTTIDDPLSTPGYTVANGINASGAIVGWYEVGGVATHGFLDLGGTFTTIDDPSANGNTSPWAINNSGEIVGSYFGATTTHGFTDIGGVFTTLDAPGSTVTWVYGVAANGEVSGTYLDGTTNAFGLLTTHGYVELNGQWTILDDPAGVPGTTQVDGISGSGGAVVGVYLDASENFHSFTYVGGVYTTVGGTGDATTGINGHGTIVGSHTTLGNGFAGDPIHGHWL